MRDYAGEANPNWRHGRWYNSAYKRWATMIQRCTNPNNRDWRLYGGRGITVAEEWKSFLVFYADMGDPPKGTMLERVDNNGPYSPENCRWASTKEQARNTRRNRHLEYLGERRCFAEWVELKNLSRSALNHRLARGWSLDKAPNTPLRCR